MRELDLFRQHLQNERAKHVKKLFRIAHDSTSVEDYHALVVEARVIAAHDRIISDLDELDRDSGEFVKKHLQ